MVDLNFSQALIYAKRGLKISRLEWEYNTYIVLMPGYPQGIKVNEATQKLHNLKEGSVIIYEPYFQKRISEKRCIMYHINTQDILANDWFVL